MSLAHAILGALAIKPLRAEDLETHGLGDGSPAHRARIRRTLDRMRQDGWIAQVDGGHGRTCRITDAGRAELARALQPRPQDQGAEETITWRVHLATPPQAVYEALATPQGRRRFWAEDAPESAGTIRFRFPNGARLTARVVENAPPHRFAITYFGGSVATFTLADDGAGGTDLTLTETGVPPDGVEENRPGWVSVLLALKAAVDHDVDLRNHDPARTWDAGYVDG